MDFDRAVEEFAKKIEEKLGNRLIYLVLYGSVSRGEAHEESDVDLLAVVRDEGAKEELFDIAAEFLKKGVLFSLIVSTPDKIGEDGFLDEVTKEGKVLYGSVKKVRERSQPGR
ncbi:MAG: nucleotidyltransferase domain-containing protein [Archaeoglobaceae archaeon]